MFRALIFRDLARIFFVIGAKVMSVGRRKGISENQQVSEFALTDP